MRRDNGNFICLIAGLVHLIAAAVLLLGLFEKSLYIFYLISLTVVVGGLLSVASFLTKSRCRFRPGWLLPQGLAGIFVGVMMLSALLIGRVSMKDILMFSLPCIAMITAILHLSVSFQIKCLGFQRWWILLSFGMIDLIFGVFAYFRFLSEPFDVITGFGIFFVLLAVQFIAEIVTYKITIDREECDM
ncbi:MAG: hypothetical protein E7384_06310 [Ruminococcaceae bacterium]|nr:hypothetical protein [Oscillospiraceae bacterium]